MAAAHILPDGVCTVLTGMLELSGGIAALANLPITLRWKLALASFFLGFGGLCVWMQTQAVLARRDYLDAECCWQSWRRGCWLR